jgi:hypothetical protein
VRNSCSSWACASPFDLRLLLSFYIRWKAITREFILNLIERFNTSNRRNGPAEKRTCDRCSVRPAGPKKLETRRPADRSTYRSKEDAARGGKRCIGKIHEQGQQLGNSRGRGGFNSRRFPPKWRGCCDSKE